MGRVAMVVLKEECPTTIQAVASRFPLLSPTLSLALFRLLANTRLFIIPTRRFSSRNNPSPANFFLATFRPFQRCY